MKSLRAYEDPLRRCLKVSEWPKADRQAWGQLLSEGDILEETAGLGHHWSPATISLRRKGYGRWLNFLQCAGLLDMTSEPAQRVTRDAIRAYLAALQHDEISSWTHWGRITQLHAVIKAMAPDVDWRWLAKIAGRLERNVVDKNDKSACMRPAHEIAAWAYSSMDTILKAPPMRDAATRYRDALMVALLICCPTLRLRNFHMIRIGTHLLARSNGYQLVFAPSETKTGNPIEIPVPASLTPYIGHYLETVRGKLTKSDDDWLWIDRYGGPMAVKSVYYQIVRTTKRAFGKPINPHAFRHAAATTVASDDPKHVGITAPLLGHTDLRTTAKHYIKANQTIAGRRLRASVDSLRLKFQLPAQTRAKGEAR